MTDIVSASVGGLRGPGPSAADLATIAGAVAAASQATTLLASLYTDAPALGRQNDPVDGNVASNNTILISTPVPSTGLLRQVKVYAHAAGTLTLVRYTLSGGTYTRQATASVTISSAGLKTLTAADFGTFPVNAGDYLGWSGYGVIAYTPSSTIDTYSWVQLAANAPATGTAVTGAPASRPEIQFICNAQTLSGAAFSTLQAAVAVLQTTVSSNALAVGNLTVPVSSQTIGKGTDPVDGTAAGTGTLIFSTPVAATGTVTGVRLFAKATGTFTVGRYTLASGTLTLVQTYPLTITATGLQTIAAAIPVMAGELLAFSGTGIYTYTSGGSSAPYYGLSTTMPATASVGSPSTSNLFQVQLFLSTPTQTVTAATFAALQSQVTNAVSGGSPVVPLTTADLQPKPTSAGWIGFLTYGQSYSLGQNSQAALSTTQGYNHLTFGGGVRSGKPGNSYGAVNTSPGTTTSKPLIEENSSSGSPAADGITNSGETACSGAANMFFELAAIQEDAQLADITVFASSPGHGGYAITQLYKGAGWYQSLLDHVTAAKGFATAAGKGYAVPAVLYMQGEQDGRLGVSRATYKTNLNQLIADINTDIRAITGQAAPVHVFIHQATTGIVTATTLAMLNEIQLAQMDVVSSNPRCHFISPVFFMAPAGDSVHITNAAELEYGRRTGRALKQLVYEGRKPDCIWPISATARGTTLRLKLRVPRFPLVLDPARFGTITDMGFKVVDDTGTLTLSNIAVSATRPDEVTMTLSRALGANPVLRHALDYPSSTNTFIVSASGCLRDSTIDSTTIAGNQVPLWHVAPGFQIPIVALQVNS